MNRSLMILTAIAITLGFASAASAQTFSDTRQSTGTVWYDTTGVPAPVQGGWVTNGGTTMNSQNGQVLDGNRTYNPVNTQIIDYRTSGCQRNLGNALACMGMQGLTQILVNRSAVREQAAATIRVDEARFSMQGGQTTGVPASVGGACRLTYPNGQVEVIQVRSADECQRAIAAAGGVMR